MDRRSPIQILIDRPQSIECPLCNKPWFRLTPTDTLELWCKAINKSGLQQAFDLFPHVKTELGLREFSATRRGHVFLGFCRQGDVKSIVNLLHFDSPDEKIDIFTYMDQRGSGNTGLHAAVLHRRFEVVWLLLFVATNLKISEFPKEFLLLASQYGVQRDYQGRSYDIRDLENKKGLKPVHIAWETPSIWSQWIASGWLGEG